VRAFPAAPAGLAITSWVLGSKEAALAQWRKLADADPHYRDAAWVGKELRWRPEMAETARQLIAEMGV
jgi:hypothetical protein